MGIYSYAPFFIHHSLGFRSMSCSVNQFTFLFYMFTVHLGRRPGEGSDDDDFENQSVASHTSTGTHSGDEGWSAFDTCLKNFKRV